MDFNNQNPEQIARDKIDVQLRASGWAIQNKGEWNHNEGTGQAVREYQTDTGPADYVLFVNSQAVGIIEAKREDTAQNITVTKSHKTASRPPSPSISPVLRARYRSHPIRKPMPTKSENLTLATDLS